MSGSRPGPSAVDEVVVTPTHAVKFPPSLAQVVSESNALAHRVESMLPSLEPTGASDVYKLQVARALLGSFLESLNELASSATLTR